VVEQVHAPHPKGNSKCQLATLVCVAALALTSIVLFAEQLVVRHLSGNPSQDMHPIIREEVSVMQLEDWAGHRETIRFGDGDIVSIRAIQNMVMPPRVPHIVDSTELPVRKPSATTTPPLVSEDGIFWSRSLEASSPPGLPEIQIQEMQQMRGRKVARLDLPDWLHCGRERNRFVTFADGSNACLRARGTAHPQLIQGEVMAFYLARILGMANTPVVVLSESHSSQWSQYDMRNDDAADPFVGEESLIDEIVALIQWIPRLTKTPIPHALLRGLADSRVGPLGSAAASGMDPEELSDLVQWSDLVVFDYLTGNYDRIASMMDGVESEGSLGLPRETVHNLGRSTKTSSLWMLDNESAFLDAYALMYAQSGNGGHGKFVRIHDQILQTVCLFRRQTVERVEALAQSQRPDQILLEFVNKGEPLFRKLPKVHADSPFSLNFAHRLDKLVKWFQTCRQMSGGHRRPFLNALRPQNL